MNHRVIHASRRNLSLTSLLVLAFGCALRLAGHSSDQKVVSVYSPLANYSLSLVERDGKDYVSLLEMLEPLGKVSSRVDGQNWRLHFNGTDGVFRNGSTRVHIHGRNIDLPAPFFLDNPRGLVPVDSLASVLPALLGIPVVFHTTARRLFIREDGTRYSAQLGNGTSPKLVLNFTSPVNPKIATEPGKLRMTFTRDPVIASGPPTVSFNATAIASASFVESNGAAEITISGGVPLLATFGNDGRTITIAPAPSSAPARQTSTAMPPANPQPQVAPPTTAAGSTAGGPQPVPSQPVFAVIDASHGGTETGATLSNTLLEKDVTLAFARQLRQEFESKGFSQALVRDRDITLTTDQRAMAANAGRPALYISIHASSDGKGARLYTPLLLSTGQDNGLFVAWDHAQASFLGSSQLAAASIAAELGKGLPTRVMPAALRPLGNIVAPAVAIEIAPRNGDIADLTATDYQQQVAASLVAGIAAVRDKLGAGR
jgi:N-acetylmuramoyl-L-alanine amidase